MTDSVVGLAEVEPGIAQVTMQDRVHKNAFTDAMTLGLLETFDRLRHSEGFRVVVITGFDTYFSTGGTREGLLALQEGKADFAATSLYSLALDCPVPVIAAMQGHGIGGGLILGLFADLVVLSRESVYTANFMRYGFTPGMGATYIVPARFGSGLANEMLLLGRNYRGEELKQRGVPYKVLPRDQVLAEALRMAREFAVQPRHSLVTLKAHLAAPHREQLPRFIEQELAMHRETFHQQEVRERIVSTFGR